MGDTLFPKIFKKSLISTNYMYGLPCMLFDEDKKGQT